MTWYFFCAFLNWRFHTDIKLDGPPSEKFEKKYQSMAFHSFSVGFFVHQKEHKVFLWSAKNWCSMWFYEQALWIFMNRSSTAFLSSKSIRSVYKEQPGVDHTSLLPGQLFVGEFRVAARTKKLWYVQPQGCWKAANPKGEPKKHAINTLQNCQAQFGWWKKCYTQFGWWNKHKFYTLPPASIFNQDWQTAPSPRCR